MKNVAHTRREFLGRSVSLAAGAVGLAPLIASSRALGRDAGVAPSERVTLAHIGTGDRGNYLLRFFREMNLCQSVAVCDPYLERRERAAFETNEYYGQADVCRPYNNFREMLERDDIDAVIIACTDHWHVPAAIAAVRAGKDVYVEKPLGPNLEQSRLLRDEVRRKGRIFQYGTQQRSQGEFRVACELVRNGRIGKLQRMEAWCPPSEAGGLPGEEPIPEGFDYDLWLGPAPMRPYNKDRCSQNGGWFISDYALGFIAGWGSHPIDIAQWGSNTDDTGPTLFEGQGVFPESGLFDTAVAWDVHCRYADGVELRFMCSATAKPVVEKYNTRWHDHGTAFFGEDGWISVDRRGIQCSHPDLCNSVIGPDEIHLYESDNHARNFIECVRSRKPAICTIDAAVRSDTISHLSDIAIRLNRPIRWNPETETIVDDDEAAPLLSRPEREAFATV